MKGKTIKATVCVIEILVILASFLTVSNAILDSNIQKKIKKYEVAVVFDNSGSMFHYEDGPESWCRAKYAMEIFGSMLNYESGDSMTIYPMWYVSTGTEPETNSKDTVQPVKIESINDLEKIRHMFTPGTDGRGTPFEPVEEAYSALKQSDKDEKWLIVLTDGTFNGETRQDTNDKERQKEFDKEKLSRLLTAKCTDGIKVQYLAIGEGISEEANLNELTNGKDFFADTARDTSEVTEKMIKICNLIFERKDLDDRFISDNRLKLDVSMDNLIVFVAGKEAGEVTLTAPDGRQIVPKSDSGVRKWSELKYSYGMREKYQTKEDRSLYGQVVIFGADGGSSEYSGLVRGDYTIDYKGDIEIYYEPSVAIDIRVSSDKDGKDIITPQIDENGEIKTLEEGDYYIFYDLIDKGAALTTGETIPVTDNDLIKCENGLNGKAIFKDQDGNIINEQALGKSGSSIKFNEGETVYFNVEGEYLDGYKISTADSAESFTFRIVKASTLKIKAEQDQSWYQLGKEDEWKPFYLNVTLGGDPLEEKIFNECEPTVSFKPELKYKIEPDAKNSRYIVYIGKDENDKVAQSAIGDYKGEFSVKCTNDNEKISPSKSDSVKFEIRNYPYWYKIAAWILSFLLVAGIILFIMSRKAMPKNIRIVADSTDFRVGIKLIEGNNAKVTYRKKQKNITIASPDYDIVQNATGSVTLSLKPIDRLWTPSKNRRVTVYGISTNGAVEEVEVQGTTYVRHPKTRKWIDSVYADDETAEIKPIEQNIRNATIGLTMKNGKKTVSTCECSLVHR